MRSVTSSEEGEASEYPSSQRSTLDSNPERALRLSAVAQQEAAKGRPLEAESDSDITVTSVRLGNR